MENVIEIKAEYNSMDKLYSYLKTVSEFECSKEFDVWEHRTNNNGQIAQCIVLKKSGMHAIKLFFVNDNAVKINHIIPNKIMHAYFGKSVKARQTILEILTGKIKEVLLAGSQQKAFEKLEKEIKKAA